MRGTAIKSGKKKQEYWRMTGWTKFSVSETSYCHSKLKKECETEHVLLYALFPDQNVTEQKDAKKER